MALLKVADNVTLYPTSYLDSMIMRLAITIHALSILSVEIIKVSGNLRVYSRYVTTFTNPIIMSHEKMQLTLGTKMPRLRAGIDGGGGGGMTFACIICVM